MTRLTAFACSLVFLAATTGCDGFGDFVDDPLGDFVVQLQLTDVTIDLGDPFELPILSGEPRAIERSVATNLDVQSVDDLVELALNPSAISFSAVPALPGLAPASGTVRLYALIDGYPLPGAPIRIEIVDGEVASVSPNRFATAQSTLDSAQVDAFFASVAPDARPFVAAYQSLSVDQVRSQIAAALSSSPVRLAFGTDVESASQTNPLAGTLTIASLDISALITP